MKNMFKKVNRLILLLFCLNLVLSSVFCFTGIAFAEDPGEFQIVTSFSPERLVPNQMLTAKVVATDISGDYYAGTKDVLVIVGLYDSNSTMINVSYISKGIPYKGTETLTAGFKLPANVTGHTARAFMWDGVDIRSSNMAPLSNVVSIGTTTGYTPLPTITVSQSPTPTSTPTVKPITPTPTQTKPVSHAAANTVVRIESYNLAGYFIRHYNFAARMELNPSSVYDSCFFERPGLADANSVSFESVNYPGYYLRHNNFELKLEKSDNSTAFKQDATFRKVSGLSNSLYISYESYNYPGMYIRNSNSLCKMTTISTDSDRADATFKLTVESNTFNNPRDTREQRPDPYVYKHTDGYYYGMHTVQRGGYIPQLIMYKSTSLSDLFTKGTNKIIWNAPATGWNNNNIWAPELYYINNTWYIYYSANFRIGVLSNSSPDPMSGTWVDRGRISPDEWAIDGTVLQQNGKMYLLWSGQFNGQVINITQMSSPATLTGPTVRLSEPTYDWETHGLRVNEGPEILQRNNKTFCVYSASFCSTQYYSLGMLTCSSTADPMARANWQKSAAPVFQASAEDGIYGTGHCCFTKSKDGTQDWLIYHSTIVPSNDYQPRYVSMQQFMWNSDGTPNFGRPCGRNIPIPRPSGE